MNPQTKLNAIRSGIVVVIGAVAFGYLTLQIGIKPFILKAQQHQQQQESQSHSRNTEILRQENREDIDEENWWEVWDRRRRMAVVQVLCYAVYAICVRYFCYYHKRHCNEAARTAVKGKKRKARAMEREAIKVIREAIKDVARAIREGNDVLERARQRCYAEEDVFNEIVKLGVEKHLWFTAYTFLVEDPARARAFFGYPVGERKEFLLQIMFGPEHP